MISTSTRKSSSNCNHQRYRIKEVPIPTYYGDEICYVNGMSYARDVARAVRRYKQTRRSVHAIPSSRSTSFITPSSTAKRPAITTRGRWWDPIRMCSISAAGEGFFAAELAANGNRVTGIDNRLLPAGRALPFERYFSADLEQGIAPVIRQLEGKRFDRVLLLDVLEHLRHAGTILRQSHEVLKRDGLLIVSAAEHRQHLRPPDAAARPVRLFRARLSGQDPPAIFHQKNRAQAARVEWILHCGRTANGNPAGTGFRLVAGEYCDEGV